MRHLALLLAAACGSGSSTGGGAPAIDSFTASRASIAPGGSAQLTAVFHGGTGAIDNGVGAVTSGTAVTVTPSATTTYTLTVTGGGKSVTGTAAITVAATSCIGSALLKSAGKTHILAGAAMQDATATATSWDARYLYIAGGLFDGSAPCASCASGCTSSGTTCKNPTGCAWWGCYQYDQNPPGEYVRDFVAAAKGRSEVPWFSYYELLQASKLSEGKSEVAAVNDAAFLTRYLADFKFMLQQIGTDTAFVHVEPDLWGYAMQLNSDPHTIAAKVREAAPADCGAQEESLAGVVRCMIALARKVAPHALIGFHASDWATGIDTGLNTSASVDVVAEAKKLATWLAAAGAADADFVAVDASDRDAGYYQSKGQNTFWDPANTVLPTFHQHLAWVKALSEELQLPVFYWQVPVGNAAQTNTNNHWKDNRVDYFFAHGDELAAAHVAGVLYGAGAGGQTTPESDGGNLVSREKAYVAAGGQALCP